ncbi:hypothetical protein PMAYCL1PPCAC_03009, partial [Pristionchus mayeri]
KFQSPNYTPQKDSVAKEAKVSARIPYNIDLKNIGINCIREIGTDLGVQVVPFVDAEELCVTGVASAIVRFREIVTQKVHSLRVSERDEQKGSDLSDTFTENDLHQDVIRVPIASMAVFTPPILNQIHVDTGVAITMVDSQKDEDGVMKGRLILKGSRNQINSAIDLIEEQVGSFRLNGTRDEKSDNDTEDEYHDAVEHLPNILDKLSDANINEGCPDASIHEERVADPSNAETIRLIGAVATEKSYKKNATELKK